MASSSSSITFENPRKVVKKVMSLSQSEGDGATVRRSIGGHEVRNLDPFLLLDEFSVSKPAGFPDHPHRGFETVTYMLDVRTHALLLPSRALFRSAREVFAEKAVLSCRFVPMQGAFTHQDFSGHKGTIRTGDVQWMTAGRGIVHSEMPAADGVHKGLQLWINLASKDKMIEPRYQELESKDVSQAEKDGVAVRIIAGEAFGVRSPVYTRTPTMYMDFTMQPGSQLHQPIPEGWNAFVYIIEGEGVFGKEGTAPASAHNCLVLGAGDGLSVWNRSGAPLRFVLAAGQPLKESVVQQGPFVMNSRAQIQKAMEDYYYGRNGFEKASQWSST
ncbi:pirin-like protein isoform X1 [Hordeum vulgare subsp. vulgare]|uniref:pirin-like protein isoform X1 n=1 Tax=Hordeum vulgare subsp. vulgare TaxID=112509 RepID=UPI000B46FEE9|nr:pirin-like protein isoform X1 [Hordeum vulgare subsp. vulgare]